MTVTGVGMKYVFVFDSSGEMTQATMPYGGYFKWVYGNALYSGSGFTQREVQTRVLSKDGTSTSETRYPFVHETSPLMVHQFTSLADPDTIGQKYWLFSQTAPSIGLLTTYKGQQFPGPTTLSQNDFTWMQDTNLNFYISSTLATSGGVAQATTNQTVDAYGNVTLLKKYNFGSNYYRTYNYWYLTSSNYTSLYIFNRVTLATVTDGTNTVTLAANAYDVGTFTGFTGGTPLEWDSTYAGQSYRGDLTSSTTPGGTSTFHYDQAGNVTSTIANGFTTTVTNASSNNFAAPTQLSVGSLANNFGWSSFLGLTSASGANGESTSTVYDTYARPTTTTSLFGASTAYTYSVAPYTSSNPATVTATTSSRWTRTTLDGFGRTVKVETGTGGPALSVAESVYGPCACSPLGKLIKQAMPHAPAASITWTVYSYDGIGRTLSKATTGSDTAGTSTYSYTGSTYSQLIGVTDPAGNTKSYAMDVFNNLIEVYEPSVGAATYYSYDLLDHLTLVSMTRGTTLQTRTFNYYHLGSMTAYLQSATNPENGTVTYSYNGYNKVASKTDAKGQEIDYTYDGLARLTMVQRFPTPPTEDPCQRETYSYDLNPYDGSYSGYNTNGRLTAVQYYGGSSKYGANGSACDTTFTEMYNYSQPGTKLGKRLQVGRTQVHSNWIINLDSAYTYDNEGRMLSVQYPLASAGSPNLAWSYDTMGRLNTMTDLNTSSSIINSAYYGPSGELLSMNGSVIETRTYNSMLQLTQLTSNGVNMTYAYPATGNNGKITSQADHAWGGETVTYLYDALNRLQKATTGTWSQTFGYDGFGNLNSVVGVNAPNLSANYNGATNRILNEPADGNGNLTGVVANTTNSYDVANRIATVGYPVGVQYSYAPGNQRVWRGVWTGTNLTTDEVTFWSVTGQRLATYKLTVGLPFTFTVAQTGTNYYFGRRLIKNADDLYVGLDRLGSVGRFYPYGQENPSASWEGREKFTGYFRDAETLLDYANQRYYLQAQGRFATPDQYMASGGPADPGSWNRYAYVGGDPINYWDPNGQIMAAPGDLGPVACPSWDEACQFWSGGGGGIGGGSIGGGVCAPGSYFNATANSCEKAGTGDGDGPPPPTCSIALYERPAGGKNRLGQHTYIVIDDPLLKPSGYAANELILQAGPSNNFPIGGTLMSQIVQPGEGFGSNVGNASDPEATGNKEIGKPYSGAYACLDIALLLNAIGNYNDSRQVLYAATPIPGTGFYNSNSFTSTSLKDIGLSFGSPGFAPGWGPLYRVPGLVP